MTKIINEIFEVDKNNTDTAMKMLYSELLDLYSISDFDKCNIYLNHFNTLPFSLDLQVAFCRITKPHKEKIDRSILIKNLRENLSNKCSTEEAESILFHVI